MAFCISKMSDFFHSLPRHTNQNRTMNTNLRKAKKTKKKIQNTKISKQMGKTINVKRIMTVEISWMIEKPIDRQTDGTDSRKILTQLEAEYYDRIIESSNHRLNEQTTQRLITMWHSVDCIKCSQTFVSSWIGFLFLMECNIPSGRAALDVFPPWFAWSTRCCNLAFEVFWHLYFWNSQILLLLNNVYCD